ncbi:hypothetical protein ACFQ1M_17900 [Sungkyunkwania multivorans]|uniref:Uncharacterized protein n=1 Tax=Sungkyunkwania multivorans TaxID=1173618 RepID=A0ABW3D6A9_9FLAO
MQSWKKKGVIYNSAGDFWWNKTHAQVPVATAVGNNVLRIYYSARDEHGRSHISYIETSAINPKEVVYKHPEPILPLGDVGSFDDSGIMPTSILSMDDRHYLYYIGWTTRGTVPFSNAIGLAESFDGGKTFKKVYQGPIIGCSAKEPYFTGTCCVIQIDERYVAYYLSCIGWKKLGSKLEPLYDLKIAVSKDAKEWKITGKVAIPLLENEGGIASATVVFKDGKYHMLFSVRGAEDYRENPLHSYKIGYAESINGYDWHRMSSNVIPLSVEGWDAQMVAYPNLVTTDQGQLLFYNGNGFGQSGFGYAILNNS